MRGATAVEAHPDLDYTFQSTRPMRGATEFVVDVVRDPDISIHAPHAGRDMPTIAVMIVWKTFQSTRPMRGATDLRPDARPGVGISIHAPHAGRDGSSR